MVVPFWGRSRGFSACGKYNGSGGEYQMPRSRVGGVLRHRLNPAAFPQSSTVGASASGISAVDVAALLPIIPLKTLSSSIGTGKMIVEFFSAAIVSGFADSAVEVRGSCADHCGCGQLLRRLELAFGMDDLGALLALGLGLARPWRASSSRAARRP